MNGRSGFITSTCGRVPPRYGATSHQTAFFVSLLAISGTVALLFWFNPAQFGFYPVCFFHKSTGLLCPGCGSLRAMHQLLHGHVATAMHFNLLFVLSLPIAAWFAVKLIIARVKQRPSNIVIPTKVLWAGLGVLVVFGILRNLPFAQDVWLAP
jgi:hypothetical protein